MAILWAAFHGTWKVLALGARVSMLAVGAYAGTATHLAIVAHNVVLAVAGAALFALVAPRVVLAVA